MRLLFKPFFPGDSLLMQQGLGLGRHMAAQSAKALTATSDEAATRYIFIMPIEEG